jgi:hypothetical protein
MRIGKKEYRKDEIVDRVGNLYQICGVRQYMLTGGCTNGTRAMDVNTGSGLQFTIVQDRGMDISLASFKGINLVYQTPNGEVNPAFYNPGGSEWLRTFFGGLLTTCGLTYLGTPGKDQGVELGLHGRYSAIPAKQVCDLSGWKDDNYFIEISGIMEDSVLFGEKLRMKRTIKSQAGSKALLVLDSVENYGSLPSPFTILYHINAGFPLLDDSSELAVTSKRIEPCDAHSKMEISSRQRFTVPRPEFAELNFFHTMMEDKDGYAYAALINKELSGGLGLYVKFKCDTLPYLSEWRMLGSIDYVVGLEPCNTKCANRGELRREKCLPFLEPREIREMQLEIGILEGADELQHFIGACHFPEEREFIP